MAIPNPTLTGAAAASAANPTTGIAKASPILQTQSGGYYDYSKGQAAAPVTPPSPTSNIPINLSQTTNPAVVSSSSASKDLNSIQSNLTATQAGIATQAQNVAQAQTAADAKATADATAAQTAAATLAKTNADQAKANALSGAPTNQPTPNQGQSGAVASYDQQGNPLDSSGNVIQGRSSLFSPEQQNLSAQMFQMAQQTQQAILGIQNGTIPLQPGEVAQVAGLQNQYQQAIQNTQTANQNYLNGLQILGAESGRQRYTPETHLGSINDAINKGNQKILDLNTQMSSAVAAMEQGFKTNDIAAIKEANDIFQSGASARVDTLTKMNDQVAAANKAIFDQGEQFKKDALDIAKYSLDERAQNLSETNAIVDNKLKTAQIAKIYNDMQTADISAASDWVKNIQAGTAKLSDVPKNLKNAVASGLANGNPQGVNSILDTTQKALADLNNYVDTNHGFTGAVGAKGISSLFGLKGTIPFTGNSQPFPGTAASDFDAKLKQVTNDVVLPNLTILHGLGRVTDREFQSLQSAITSLNPSLSEAEFKKELQSVTDTVNQKVIDLNTHNGISLPTNPDDSGGTYNGVTLPN